jgi:hypothetical protein
VLWAQNLGNNKLFIYFMTIPYEHLYISDKPLCVITDSSPFHLTDSSAQTFRVNF